MPSRRRLLRVALLALIGFCLVGGAVAAPPEDPDFRSLLQRFDPDGPAVADDPVAEAIAAALSGMAQTAASGAATASHAVLDDFYGERGFRPVWLEDARPGDRAAALGRAIAGAPRDGLDPNAYPLPAPAGPSPEDLANYDLAMSGLLIRWATDLNDGRVTPKQADPEHYIYHRDLDPAGVLEGFALTADADGYLAALAPASSLYRGLRRALLAYRRLAAGGGWEPLAEGPTLKPGERDPRVGRLRETLRRTGDLSLDSDDPDLFDQGLAFAVETFQRRHGLDVDGAVGPQTLAALNVPVDERIRQIETNMERARWLPAYLGDRYVFVNMAGFELDVVEYGSIGMTMRVIVGKPYRQTPVFSGQISYLEFNPYWTVPYSIATKDILPKASRDPGYLVNEGIRVFAGGSEVSVWSVNWNDLGRGNFPYTLRQDPGRQNALGRVKFMFPNRHAVYLHDTPSRSLFSRSVRTFSSGCIRVERPLELAAELLRDDGWPMSRIRAAVESGERTVVRLAAPVPVHLTYVTAWAGEGGSINFRSDVYGRDARLADALIAQR